MSYLARIRRNYRRYRLYNKYSNPIIVFVLDAVVLIGKVVFAVGALSLVYFAIAALTPESQHNSQLANQSSSEPVAALALEPVTGDGLSEEVSDVLPKLAKSEETGSQRQTTENLNPGDVEISEADTIAAVTATIVDEQWIYAQDSASYTVQFGSSAEEALLEEYAAEFPAEMQFAIYRVKGATGGENAFGIVSGLYASVADARKALEQLDEELRRYEPWIRQFGDVSR